MANRCLIFIDLLPNGSDFFYPGPLQISVRPGWLFSHQSNGWFEYRQ